MSGSEDDEVLEMFLVESREHLEDIENDLLTIESQGENTDPDLVNRVFRAIHTIKGAAGFFGLIRIKELSHVMEHLLDRIRKKKIVPVPDIISVLLDGADVLSGMINNPDTSNDLDIKDLVARIKSGIDSALSGEQKGSLERMVSIKSPDGKPLFDISELTLQSALRENRGGNYIYLLSYDFITDIEARGKSAPQVISELQELTFLIETRLDVASVGTLEEDATSLNLPFYVLLATVMEKDLIGHFLELTDDKIHLLSEEELGFNVKDKIKGAMKAAAEAASEKAEPVEKPPLSEDPVSQQEEPTPAAQAEPAEPVEPVKRKPVEEKPKKAAPARASKKVESNIRVNVNLLDRLMNLAGELVLTRNELMQGIEMKDDDGIERASQKVNHITSELQEAIMSTRMQSIGVVFTKFHRIVRDLSKTIGKQINLSIEGEQVELDKTIIEAIGDPLTHLIRNACDHGVESPEKRIAAGKPPAGNLQLNALHEAGQVVIEIRDDGGGINTEAVKKKALSQGMHTQAELDGMTDGDIHRMIFKPGFSTAAKITEVSGRGVGMDVVYTNLSRLGGTIDIHSVEGRGTTFRIRLPLTLAIIPSLLVELQGERFAIPQINLLELVRIPAERVKERMERIGQATVMRLRGELLPLIRLRDVLGVDPVFVDEETGEERIDRRQNIADRRSIGQQEKKDEDDELASRAGRDRRRSLMSAVNIAVVSAGSFRYGLIVDALLDSAEIVVKPLGYHLKDCRIYAGATILGTGQVACILDVEGISAVTELNRVQTRAREALENKESADNESLLLVKNGPDDIFAIPLGLVVRIETAKTDQIENTGGQTAIKYRGTSLALFSIEQVANVSPREPREDFNVIVFKVAGREVGLIVSEIIDIVEREMVLDTVTHKQPGIFGSAIIDDRITLFLDMYGLVSRVVPDWTRELNEQFRSNGNKTVLVVEDSPFFMKQIRGFLEDVGYPVLTAEDGELGLQLLEKNIDSIGMVLTDIEMPNMNGWELTRRIRERNDLAHLPVIAITSLSGETATETGIKAGLDDHLVKLDREEIVRKTQHFITHGRPVPVGS